MEYRLVDRLPTVEEFVAVTRAVGWADAYDPAAIPASLAASLHAVVAVEGDRVIGLGRLIGDGAIYYYLQDLAVVPERQRRGVGAAILGRLEEWIAGRASARTFVGLFATGGSVALYRRFGYAVHEDMTGMFRVGPRRTS
ncbi:GNAT family N-acetyltransferase [Micromonospora purpureochromogenes]|uniref:Acetyltransferase (GNAT) domain-containing protein n=1 Tax=Micromonospora purpureochromogenes TaxID=47872 RepID=A0A1C4XGX4_9ACTN|nr:GNAT family N-acetyltransferase [Micromonospora purpureochromogenes]NYF60156.1 GNAT superfamily N-acetyltransferase [Micromonospora purpureochromogenes]SCF07607.1 Acetyltransferase (GNAT) domain-containing protein [Micromonospora purpureochromogenes]